MEMYEMYVVKAIEMSIIWNKGHVSLNPLPDSKKGKFMLNVFSHDDWIINWWEFHAGKLFAHVYAIDWYGLVCHPSPWNVQVWIRLAWPSWHLCEMIWMCHSMFLWWLQFMCMYSCASTMTVIEDMMNENISMSSCLWMCM